MDKNDLLKVFETMLSEHWKYTASAAEKGNVDCSGAFVYAYKQYGKNIYHGSNRIARVEAVQLLPISEAKPGMAAFKARNPGDSRYNLPSSYKKGAKYYNGDLRDFYHIGLVSERGTVLNAQSSATGFVESKIDSWTCVAYLKQVDYGDDAVDDSTENSTEDTSTAKESIPAVVTAESGKTVNLRATGSLKGMILERVPVGTTVEILDETDDWALVNSGKYIGFMRTTFLKKIVQEDTIAEILNRLAALEKRMEMLESEGGVG